MQRKPYTRILALAACAAGLLVASAQAAEMALIPSHADGAFTIAGNEITIPTGGVRVFLDAYLSDWTPALLLSFEADMAQGGSAFSGGSGGSLGFARPACTHDGYPSAECAGLFGVPSAAANCWFDDSFCVPAYLDWNDPDWVFAGLDFMSAVGTSGRWGFQSIVLGGGSVADPGGAFYGGTYVIEVSPDAAGTFTVELFAVADGGNTMMLDPEGSPLPQTLSPARITVGSIGGSGACCNLTACTPAASAGACTGTFLPGASCSTVGLCGSASGTIGPAGGTIETPDGTASVDFPAGCVSSETAMSIEFGNWPDRIFDVLVTGGPGRTLASYTFEPSGSDFCDTAELCLTVNLAGALLTADDCESVEFQHREGRCAGSPSTECHSDGECGGVCNFTFTAIPLTSRDCTDPSHARFCANIGHFSDYGLVGPDSGSIPTVSEWGLMVLTLLLLVGGKVYYRREHAACGG